jgi:hypothetical protein
VNNSKKPKAGCCARPRPRAPPKSPRTRPPKLRHNSPRRSCPAAAASGGSERVRVGRPRGRGPLLRRGEAEERVARAAGDDDGDGDRRDLGGQGPELDDEEERAEARAPPADARADRGDGRHAEERHEDDGQDVGDAVELEVGHAAAERRVAPRDAADADLEERREDDEHDDLRHEREREDARGVVARALRAQGLEAQHARAEEEREREEPRDLDGEEQERRPQQPRAVEALELDLAEAALDGQGLEARVEQEDLRLVRVRAVVVVLLGGGVLLALLARRGHLEARVRRRGVHGCERLRRRRFHGCPPGVRRRSFHGCPNVRRRRRRLFGWRLVCVRLRLVRLDGRLHLRRGRVDFVHGSTDSSS